MASSWGGVVSEQADLISIRLRQLVSSGLHFLHQELGIDLGLKPELYPARLFLYTALIGLVLLLALFAAYGGARRRKQGAVRNKDATENTKEVPVKTPKPDEPKKKNKKKASEKKNQSNGRTVSEPREQVKVVKEFPKQTPPPPSPPPSPPSPSPPVLTTPPLQPPAPIDTKAEKAKKSKKKPKPEVKPTQAVSSTDGKEPDEGAWETKISNREKRQQRKKEKGSNGDSGSPGGGQQIEQPAAPVNTKKNKESQNLKAAKGDAKITPGLPTWNNMSSVNSGKRIDPSMKPSPKVSASDREKSSVGIKTSGHRTSEPLAWTQESGAGSWPILEGRMKPEVNRINYSMLRLNPSAAGIPGTQSTAELGNGLPITDEWSGFNGLGMVDPSSDWNAPTELWGNYDELKSEAPAAKEAPVSQLQQSDDDNDKGDPSGSGKSKRKKKKKKKLEDGNVASQVTTESSTASADSEPVKPRPHIQAEEPTKQIISPQSGQKKSDQNLEPPKQVQKKKARRET